jgi:photoactive yellow protein
MIQLAFDAPDARDVLERLDRSVIDELPFGVIRLSATGEVVLYSRTEATRSGRGARPTVGKDFFLDIAPCMNTPAFRHRIAAEAAAGAIDLEIGHTGDFTDRDRFLRIRVLSARGGGLWLMLERDGGTR